MIMPFDYIFLIVGIILLIFGFIINDYFIKTISCIILMVFGMWIAINGIEAISNLATQAFGSICIGIGFYIWMMESYDLYKDM